MNNPEALAAAVAVLFLAAVFGALIFQMRRSLVEEAARAYSYLPSPPSASPLTRQACA